MVKNFVELEGYKGKVKFKVSELVKIVKREFNMTLKEFLSSYNYDDVDFLKDELKLF